MSTTQPLSEVSVANMAASTLEEYHLTSFSEDSALSRFMAVNFGPCRDEVLRAHPWAFAEEDIELAASGTSPLFGWDYKYAWPDDCVRVLPLRCEGSHNGDLIPYKRKGKFIYTDECAPLQVTYIRRVTDMSEWDVDAARVLAEYLAILAAQRITGKASYLQKARELHQQAMQKAVLADALDGGTPEKLSSDDIHGVRLAG